MTAWHPSLSWRYTLREVRRRPGRTLLTLIGILLGVAGVTAVHASIDVTRSSYVGLFAPLTGLAALEIRPGTGVGDFAPDLAALERIPGVRTAAPLIQAPAALAGPAGPVSLLVLGIDPTRDRDVRNYHLLAGSDLGEGPGMLLEANFARRHGLRVGDSARLLTPRGPVEERILGLLAAEGPARFKGGAVAFLSLPRAQTLFLAPGKVHMVQLVLERSASLPAVEDAVSRLFPGAIVRPPSAYNSLAAGFLQSIEQALASLSSIALVAGALVILNTFLMNLGERQRQLALLRALGMTRRQLMALLLRQALLLGSLGTLLGVPLGLLLASGLLRLNEWYMLVPLPRFAFSWTAVLLGGTLGPLLTVVAVIVPVRRAADRSPLADMRPRVDRTENRPPSWPLALGAILIAGMLLFEVSILRAWIAPQVASQLLPIVVSGTMIGCVCLLPRAVPWLLATMAPLIRRLFGVEGRLTVRQLQRHEARTGLTVGVLFAAVTASVSFGNSFLNNLRDIRLWYDHAIDADFLVRAVMPDPALVVAPAPLPLTVPGEVQRLPGCAHIERFRFISVPLDGVTALVIAREFRREDRLTNLVMEVAADQALERLRHGEVLLGSALAARLHVAAGDTVRLPGSAGVVEVRVAALVKEYSAGGMALYADWDHAARWFAFAAPHGLFVRAEPGASGELAAALAEYCQRHDLLFQRNRDFFDIIQRVITGVLVLVVGLVLLISLVAAVGVVNTLSTNVLDQTRQLGVLRAVGLKRGQLRKMVVAQAVTLALVSCLPGAPAGLLLAYLMNRATPGLLGHHIPFHIHGVYLAVCLVGLAGLSALAALVPAERAARLTVVDALRYE